jgi:hypothetical protein
MRIIIVAVAILGAGILPLGAEEELPASQSIPEGYVRVISQPNGWGRTPEAAVADLRNRIYPMYRRVWGHMPGFTIVDRYALVEISDGRMWQADGTLYWYAPKAKTGNKRVTVGRDRGLRTK